jgi:hypothetical protein
VEKEFVGAGLNGKNLARNGPVVDESVAGERWGPKDYIDIAGSRQENFDAERLGGLGIGGHRRLT